MSPNNPSAHTHDTVIDETLSVLRGVRAPQHLAQRVHARIAREPLATAERPAFKLVPWMTLCAVSAGLVIAVVARPGSNPNPQPAAPGVASSVSQPAAPLHPPLMVEQRQGRAAALNASGAIATAKARAVNSKEDALAAKADPHHPAATREAKNSTPAAPAPVQ